MSKRLRCQRCFAPKNEPDEVCEFCGLDPMKDKPIASFGDDLMKELLGVGEKDDTPYEELSLEEKIRRASIHVK